MEDWERAHAQGPMAVTSVSLAAEYWETTSRSSTPSTHIPATTSDDEPDNYSSWLGRLAEPAEPTLLPGLTWSEVEASREFERSRIHFVSSELATGDTLVFIDCPECPRDYRGQADCRGMAYQSQKLRVSSQKLLATGSSRFAEMLNPTYQFRIKRRRRMVNSMPNGVKFLLDLTPPSEGDDLVFQMTELSLTPGLMKWWTSSSIHKIDPALVTGHDDVCYCSMTADQLQQDANVPYQLERPGPLGDDTTHMTLTQEIGADTENAMSGCLRNGVRINPLKLIQMKADGRNDLYHIPAFRNIPDYCPFRHRNSVIRLLMLIEGKHVTLDSATKLWTLVGVAKIFDCASLLRDDVAQWIMHGNNSRFIEVLPEEALQLGYALQLPQVTECAFRILVNELAIEEAATPGSHSRSNHVTVFGRKRGDVGDELSNIVQHAARELVDRVTRQLHELRSSLFLDSSEIPPWIKLCRLEQALKLEQAKPEAAYALTRLQALMDAFRGMVPKVLDTADTSTKLNVIYSPSLHSGMDFDRATYVEPKDFDSLEHIMHGFNFVQKLLCPLMYHQMTEEFDHFFRFSKLFQQLPTPYFKEIDRLMTLTELALQRLIEAYPCMVDEDEWAILFGPSHSAGSKRTVKVPLVDPYQFSNDLREALKPFLCSWIRHDIDPTLNITRHMLLTLNSNEMKFLPLWAGGCNDGTGGVFEPLLPPADLGPNGPGPAYHTGVTVPSAPSSSSGTLAEDIRAMNIMGSTTAGSIDVHDSVSTVYRPDKVIADDVSVASEAFTATGSDFQDARFAVPAAGQTAGQALEIICDVSTDDDFKSVSTDTESNVTGSVLSQPKRKDGPVREEEDDDDLSFIWDEGNASGSDDDMEFV